MGKLAGRKGLRLVLFLTTQVALLYYLSVLSETRQSLKYTNCVPQGVSPYGPTNCEGCVFHCSPFG